MLTKIGEGRFRDVYSAGPLAVKLMKEKIRKNYPFGSFEFKLSLYTLLKYGIKDFNEEEYRNYFSFADRIPDPLQKNFYKILEIHRGGHGTVLHTEMIRDSDGNPSKNLIQHGRVNDASFWEQIGNIERFMLDEKVYLLDICGCNFAVKQENDAKIPVWIDYKRLGHKAYPWQISTMTDGAVRNKVKRRFERLRTEFS